MNRKISTSIAIAIVFAGAVLAGLFAWQLTFLLETSSVTIGPLLNTANGREKACLGSGGKIRQALCCTGLSFNALPSTCFIGACGCSSNNSKPVRICDCGLNKCFNGRACQTVPDVKNREIKGGDIASWKVYQSDKYGFGIKYPENLVTIEKIPTYIPTCDPESSVNCLSYLGKEYERTTFEGASVSINIIKSAKTEQVCNGYGDRGIVADGTIEVNGIVYVKAENGGAALGHWMSSYYYRTFYNGQCIELAKSVTGTNFSSLGDLGNIEEFTGVDEENVVKFLEAIVSTFRFLQ